MGTITLSVFNRPDDLDCLVCGEGLAYIEIMTSDVAEGLGKDLAGKEFAGFGQPCLTRLGCRVRSKWSFAKQ